MSNAFSTLIFLAKPKATATWESFSALFTSVHLLLLILFLFNKFLLSKFNVKQNKEE